MENPKYITELEDISQLSTEEKRELSRVTARFQMRVNEYYLNLIDWEEPRDPLRRIVIPDLDELEE